MKSILNILKLNKKQNWLLIIGFILCVIACFFKLAIPLLLGKAIDVIFATTSEELESFNKYLTMISICLALSTVLTYLFNIILSYYTQGVIKTLRNSAYYKLNRVSISYIDSHLKGNMINLVTGDIENISTGLLSGFSSLFEGIFTILFTIVFMFMINYLLAIVVIVLTPLSIFVSNFVASKCATSIKEHTNNLGDVSSVFLEALNNEILIKANGYEKEYQSIFSKLNDKTYLSNFKSMFASSWINPSTRIVNNIIYSTVVVCGALLTFLGGNISIAFTIGNLSSFLSYTNQYMKPFNEISNVVSELQYAIASSNRILNLLKEEEDVDQGEKDVDVIKNVTFKNVHFSYETNRPVINNFNLDIYTNHSIALVGETGCGKTTIINLLMRFYDITSGEISFNNGEFDIRELKKSSLRKNIGMVLQDSWIFNGTVMENIRYSNPLASDKEVIEAAKKAHVDETINKLSDGYNTVISSSSGLSEGEKQLICIARMFLKESNLLILDEATSSIDILTESKIVKSVDELRKNKTSIVIAHRLSTIKSSDLIVFIKNGTIAEMGNHDELIAKKGYYYKMYNSQ